jgi:uncharacterized membrane protein YfcA
MTWFGTAAAIAVIVLVAATLQRAVGFGFALLAVPLMAFVVPTKSAVVIVFLTGATTSFWLAVRLVHRIEWRTAGRLGAGAVLGAPVGVVILSLASSTTLRLVLGVTTSVAAVWIIVSSRRMRARPVEHRRSTTFGLGLASGVLNTSLATSGPPLVYELRATGFHGDRFRATISAVFAISNLIGLPLLLLAGLITADDLAYAAISIPLCVAGFLLGGRLAVRMTPSRFAWAVDLLLLATGLVTIAKVL